MTLRALALTLLLPSVALAAAPGLQKKAFERRASTNDRNILEGVALNAAAATRTVTLETAGFSKLRVWVFYTNSNATTVTSTLTCSGDGTNYASETTKSCSAGACTVYAKVDTHAVSADSDFALDYDVSYCAKVQIVFGGASADGSDLVDVQAIASVGQ